jgi:hypothetical protein
MLNNINYILKIVVTCLKKVMKKLLLIALIGITFNSYAQKYKPPKGWKSPELYLPATILASTYTTNSILSDNITYGQRTSIAVTGAITSLITHFVFRKIRTSKGKFLAFK